MEKLVERYNNAIGYLTKEAAIAISQVLEEQLREVGVGLETETTQ